MSESKRFRWPDSSGEHERYGLEFDEKSVERAIQHVEELAPVPELTNLEKIDLREKLKKNIEIAKNTEGAYMAFDPYTSAAVEFLIDNYDYDPRNGNFINGLRSDMNKKAQKEYGVGYDILRSHFQKKQDERNKL